MNEQRVFGDRYQFVAVKNNLKGVKIMPTPTQRKRRYGMGMKNKKGMAMKPMASNSYVIEPAYNPKTGVMAGGNIVQKGDDLRMKKGR